MYSPSALCYEGFAELHSRRKRYRIRPRPPSSTAPPTSVPGVSILRPLKGLDTNLYENLESTFTQQYPNYEILFSVADEDDQALPVVRDLLAKYRHFNAKVVIGMDNFQTLSRLKVARRDFLVFR
jgi:ceramide glucosyltransferase